MNILLLNPNTSAAVTDRMLEVARDHAAPGTVVLGRTAPRGVPYIASRAEAQIGGAVLLEMLAEETEPYEAAIVAAFADPGLGAAREMLAVPVVGMAEAAMLTACMLGRAFAIVTFTPALDAWYRECVDYHGLAGRLAGIHCLDEPFASVVEVQHEKEEALVGLANRAVAGGADVVILAGAPLSGLAARVRNRIPVPTVDGIAAAVKQAEALATLEPRKATAGSFRRPPPKSSIGLAPGLARMIADDQDARSPRVRSSPTSTA